MELERALQLSCSGSWWWSGVDRSRVCGKIRQVRCLCGDSSCVDVVDGKSRHHEKCEMCRDASVQCGCVLDVFGVSLPPELRDRQASSRCSPDLAFPHTDLVQDLLTFQMHSYRIRREKESRHEQDTWGLAYSRLFPEHLFERQSPEVWREWLTCDHEECSPRMSRPWGRVVEERRRRLKGGGLTGREVVAGFLLNLLNGEVDGLGRERREGMNGDASSDVGFA